MLSVLRWAPSFLILPSADTWQLIINTATTIVTFLLAAQHKLNAIASGLGDLMAHLAGDHPQLHRDRTQLREGESLHERSSSREGAQQCGIASTTAR